jgi:hypothetical protein
MNRTIEGSSQPGSILPVKRPLDYLGSAGLLWAINGGRLLELHRDWAVIDVPVHGSKRIFSRRNVDPAKITLPWAKPTSSRPPAAFGCGFR